MPLLQAAHMQHSSTEQQIPLTLSGYNNYFIVSIIILSISGPLGFCMDGDRA